MSIIKKILSIFEKQTEVIDIEGIWHGIYKYSNGYSPIIRDKVVEFTTNIVFNSDRGFSGIIKEAENGVGEDAEISGKIKGHKIMFIKKYQHFHQIDQDGNSYTSEDGPMIINYFGKYNTKKAKFFGRWTIEVEYEHEDGRKTTSSSVGFWEMWRKG